MIYRIVADLAFNKVDKRQMEALRDALAPFFRMAVNINEGSENQEIGFIDVRECNHDDAGRTTPDKVLARYEVGRGKVI